MPPYPVLRTHRPAGGSTAQPKPLTAIGGGGEGGESGGEGGEGGGEGGEDGGEGGGGGEGGDGGEDGGDGGGGGDGGAGGGGGRKQSSQPARLVLPSVTHWIGVPSGTTPSGESVPQ